MTPTHREKHQLLFFSAPACMIPASYKKGPELSIGQFCLQGRLISLVPPCFLILISIWLRKVYHGNCCLLKNYPPFYNQFFFFKTGEEDTFLSGIEQVPYKWVASKLKVVFYLDGPSYSLWIQMSYTKTKSMDTVSHQASHFFPWISQGWRLETILWHLTCKAADLLGRLVNQHHQLQLPKSQLRPPA